MQLSTKKVNVYEMGFSINEFVVWLISYSHVSCHGRYNDVSYELEQRPRERHEWIQASFYVRFPPKTFLGETTCQATQPIVTFLFLRAVLF